MLDVDEQHEQEPEEITVAVVGPDPRLLLLLVATLVGVAVGVIFLFSGGEDDRVSLGGLGELAAQAQAGPVRLAELPHLVVTRTATRSAVYDARWGQDNGAVLLSPEEQLVVLETRDPADGADLTWCRAAQAFAHPDGVRWYAADGTVLAGTSPRGLDRRGVTVVGEAVFVHDDRWVSGQPLSRTQTAWEPRGDCGSD